MDESKIFKIKLYDGDEVLVVADDALSAIDTYIHTPGSFPADNIEKVEFFDSTIILI